ncbi:hypothetical protein EDI_235830 [Entamoeba dispar SAW760]|uniref:Uncharacterized protein n=1 Tax=Entamoeba dispar (strain ATCC PRA-260 / SAW760) TaxID=370354 RepID=B0EQT8_ENTDS|nr:uncharacterized protein EDI_235830 [Entamoeba dispar SAW760]EDR23099.1 hypothetical protein EDI_235830 [Entamoeba dispar SAW760]|eukprot:EDR23099.1 hypothetical protein EDI_235830 [Entamoeba dispar SAW760]
MTQQLFDTTQLPQCPNTPEIKIVEDSKPKKAKITPREKLVGFIKRQMKDDPMILMDDIIEENGRLRKELEKIRIALTQETKYNEELRNGILKERLNLFTNYSN